MKQLLIPAAALFLAVSQVPFAHADADVDTADAGTNTVTIDGEEVDLNELMDAQRQAMQAYASIPWVEGPTTGDIGGLATIEVPAGYQFTGPRGAQQLLELYGNPPNPDVKGAIVPTAEDEDWTLVFQYSDIGYVDDTDREDLDAEALISSFRAGIEPGNAQRRALGLDELRSMDWAETPFYDPATNNLTWALNLGFDDGNSINYDIRLLGRRGVMEVTLLGDPETYSAAVPKVKGLLSSYAFNPGSTYGEFRSGDKVAAIGLTGLVAGGAAVAAAKTGLLAKLGLILAKGGKAVILGVVAVFAGLGSFIKKMFGGGGDAAGQT